MYIKVYIENSQLFREDNGCLIGEAVISLLDPTLSLYKCNDKTSTLLYGHIDTSGSFISLCNSTSCSYACLSKREPDCRYCSKDSNEGFYIEI